MMTNQTSNGAPVDPVPTEVRERAKRRLFSVEYKRRIVAEIDAAPRGSKGRILRREGLWATVVDAWRKEFSSSPEPRKRGRKPSADTQLKKDYQKLQREHERLKVKLEHAALIIAAQKKVARLFEQMNENDDAS